MTLSHVEQTAPRVLGGFGGPSPAANGAEAALAQEAESVCPAAVAPTVSRKAVLFGAATQHLLDGTRGRSKDIGRQFALKA